MKITNLNKLLLYFLMVLITACQKEQGFEGNPAMESFISLKLKTNKAQEIMVLSKTTTTEPDLNLFQVRLENTRAEQLRSWRYDSLPASINVVPGSYKIVASYGSDSLFPAFETPYYHGETKLTLKAGTNIDTTVNCAMAATKIAITFDPSFSYDYSNYSVDIKTTGDSLHFTRNEKRTGYFKPGKLRIRFILTPKDSDSTIIFYPTPIAETKANEFYNITLKAQSNNGASTITIATDSSSIEIPVDVTLPPTFLPKPLPKVTLQGFSNSEQLEITEGISRQAAVVIYAAGGLTSLKIMTNSTDLQKKGWPEEIDLIKATPEQQQILKTCGLLWSDILNQQDSIRIPIALQFNNVIKLLETEPGTTTLNSFTILSEDQFGQKGEPTNLNINVAPPVFEFIQSPGENNLFAKQAIYEINYISDAYSPEIQHQHSDGSWQTTTNTFKTIGSNGYRITGRGLEANTNYHLRIKLGKHILDAGTYSTENIATIPNQNMDEWWLETQKNGIGQKTYLYRTYNQGESSPWWANNNQRSTWWPVSPVDQNSCPAVSYVTGGNARNGKAAELRSVGSGSGFANTGSICYDDSRIPGMLFIGDYTYKKPNETINYGRPFTSRPTQLTFWYQYMPYKNDEFEAYIEIQYREGNTTKILGSGKCLVQKAESDTEYKQAIVDINYTDISPRATHIFIRFLSSTTVQPEVNKNISINLVDIKDGWKAHVGSVLRIDDIALEY